MAANSSVDRAEPQVPLRRIPANLACATAGSPLPGRWSVTKRPFPCGPRCPHPIRVPAARSTRSIVAPGVPFLVPPAHGFQGPGRFFLGRIGAEPVLARTAAVVRLHRVVPEAIPPALLIVHTH